jgi:hypothetical protein
MATAMLEDLQYSKGTLSVQNPNEIIFLKGSDNGVQV